MAAAQHCPFLSACLVASLGTQQGIPSTCTLLSGEPEGPAALPVCLGPLFLSVTAPWGQPQGHWVSMGVRADPGLMPAQSPPGPLGLLPLL